MVRIVDCTNPVNHSQRLQRSPARPFRCNTCRIELEMQDLKVTSKPKTDPEEEETAEDAVEKYRSSKSEDED